MSMTGLPDGIINPAYLEEIQVRNNSRGRVRAIPPLKQSAAGLASLLMTEGRVSDRDWQLMETLLNATPLLSRHQIQRLFWRESNAKHLENMASNRLRKLVYPYYILGYNPNAAIGLQSVGLPSCHAYYLGIVGIELLAMQRRRANENFRRPKQAYNAMAAPVMLAHDLMISEVYTRVVLQTLADDDIDFRWTIQWRSIIRDQAHNELARPDATLAFHQRERQKTHHFFLEVNRDPSPRRWTAKVKRYEDALSSGLWRKSGMEAFPKILVISQQGDMKKIAQIIHRNRRATDWLFMEWDDYLQTADFNEGWRNVEGKPTMCFTL